VDAAFYVRGGTTDLLHEGVDAAFYVRGGKTD
jgi:hypothetical protein